MNDRSLRQFSKFTPNPSIWGLCHLYLLCRMSALRLASSEDPFSSELLIGCGDIGADRTRFGCLRLPSLLLALGARLVVIEGISHVEVRRRVR